MNGAQILPDLWQVGGPGFSGPQDAASYLLRFDEKAVLIDAGCGGETALIKRNIHQCLGRNVELEYLLLTHCHFDHTGGAQGIRKAFGCKIVCHGLDAAYLERGDSEVTGASW